ncbi:MAG: magnesium transporter MgtE N-terminal domain-containing protein, partial [Planctomycetota bacterium]
MTHEAPPTALERLVREGSEEDLRRFLLLLQPPEIADIIEALDKPEDRTRAFRAIVGPKRPNVMRELRGEEREDLLEDLAPEETARLVSAMKSDDAADVLQDLDEEDQERVLEHVPPQDRAEIEEVLEYPEDTAGGIMQTERVDVREDQTVRDARQEIRRTRHDIGELHEIFVVDAEGRLKGWVKERAFILASDDDRIALGEIGSFDGAIDEGRCAREIVRAHESHRVAAGDVDLPARRHAVGCGTAAVRIAAG